MKQVVKISFAVLFMYCCAFAVDAENVHDAKALIGLAPVISLDEAGVSSFEVKGTLDYGSFFLRFVILGQEPDRISMWVLDPNDNTPILIGTGGSYMLYSPVASELLMWDMVSSFRLCIEKSAADPDGLKDDEQKLVFNFFLHTHKEKKDYTEKDKTERQTLINIRPILETLLNSLKVERQPDGSYLLSGRTARGSGIKAYVDPGREEGPYKRVELFNADNDNTPFIVLDHVRLNQPISPDSFVFPRQKILDCGLKVKELSTEGMINTMISMGRLAQTFFVRFVLSGREVDPQMKQAAEKLIPQGVDWDNLKKQDKEAGKILRDVFKEKIPAEKAVL